MKKADWQYLIAQGNQHFDEQQLFHAEDCYLGAYDLLLKINLEQELNVHYLLGWVSVCHNLATVYEWLGENRNALRYLMTPYSHLLDLTQEQSIDPEIEDIVFRSMNLVLVPILLFAQRHNICEDCCKEFPLLDQLLKKQYQTHFKENY